MADSLLQPDTGEIKLDPDKNYLTELVGEGKKFATAEDLAKGKYYADQTVEVMKKRLDVLTTDYLKLREENNSQANLKEMMTLLEQKLASSDHTPANEDNREQPKFDPKDIEILVDRKVREIDATKKASENFNTFRTKLTERFGTNEDALNQQIETLGLDKEDLVSLARKSPTAALNSLGIETKKEDSFNAPPRSQQRNDNFALRAAPVRSWSYYQNLKKTNPNLWSDRKTAIQMNKDAVELGTAFYDGDFYVKGLHE